MALDGTTVQTISALSSVFTPSASCLANVYTVGGDDAVVSGNGYIEKGWTTGCYPSGAPTSYRIYGPSLYVTDPYASYITDACFDAYTSRGCVVSAGTTTVFCCPS